MTWEAILIFGTVVGVLFYLMHRGFDGEPFTASGFLLGAGLFILFFVGGIAITNPESAARQSGLVILCAPFFVAALVAGVLEVQWPYRWQYPQYKLQEEAERENYERDQLKKLQDKYGKAD